MTGRFAFSSERSSRPFWPLPSLQNFWQTAFVLLVLLLLCLTPVVTAGDGQCASSSYYCPNCGGINVTDCLQCDGYLSSEVNDRFCYRRILFAPYNDNKDDPDHYYTSLWRDLVGMVVWFVAAGVATACGVGGGGIYVPLGMLLLGFAPKPASGLSQASIFGASVGGLILNLRDQHPNTNITAEKEQDKDQHAHAQEGGAEQPAPKTYTRPLVDYNMALFLAPLEMAGAVLGVLIQKILPNWLYLTLAAIILGFTAYKTYKKWWSTRATERKKAQAAAAAATETQEESPAEAEEQPSAEEAGAAVQASMHTKHIQTNPTVRKVDWTAASNVYSYSSDDFQPENSEQDNSRSQNNNYGSLDGNPETIQEQSQSKEEDQDDSEVKNQESPVSKEAEENPNNAESADVVEPTNTESSLGSTEQSLYEQRVKWLEKDARQYPKEKLLALVVLWIGLVLLTFMKGGKGVDSIVGITCQSPWYGVLIAIQFLWTLGFALVFGLKLVKEQKLKEDCDYPFLENDVLWDYAKLRFYAFFTFCAGIVAGLIGVGGGMVLGPLMLVMGIHPRVSSATTGTMIVLTSSSVAVLFVTSGLVPWQYAIFFFFVCLIGAYIGKRYIDGYVKRSGKASILIFLLATIIALATIGCIVIVLTRLAAANWCIDGFQAFCSVGSSDDGDGACGDEPESRLLVSFLRDVASSSS